MKTMWEGHKFFEAEDETAACLVKEDKAEICVGNDLKYRHQFTGYLTREMRSAAPVEISEPEPAPVKEIDWKKYKAEAKKKLGLKRITEAQVKEWMAENGLI